jgi:polar amino acid transport system substrate-binding protein
MNKFLFILLLILSTKGFAQKVHLGVEDSWPPYANNLGQGISTNIVREAFSKVGISVQLSVFPYSRVLHSTITGVIDGCYNVTRQDSTNDKFIFGDTPILKANASYFSLKGSKKQYKGLSDIPDGTAIAVIQGYEYGNDFERHKKRFMISKVNDQFQIIKMLLSKRVDGAIMFDQVAQYHLNEMNKSGALENVFVNHKSDIYVAFSKKNPKSKFFAKKLDEGIQLLKQKNEYQKLLDIHF